MRRAAQVVVVALAIVVAGWIFVVGIHSALTDQIDDLWILSWLGLLVVGAFLVARKPDNRVGWTVTGIGLLASSGGLMETWAPSLDEPWGVLLAILASVTVGGFVLIPLFLLWYPTGRVASPGWLWVEKTLFALGGLLVLYYLLRPGELSITSHDNPLGIGFLGPLRDSTVEVGAGLLVVLLGALAFASLVVRWRRGQGQERSQIKLVAVTALAVMASLVLFLVVAFSADQTNSFIDVVQVLWFVVGVNAVAAAIAVAILRYRLYEIDRIVSRTVSYALVVGLLAVVFFGLVAVVTELLPAQSDLAVAGSTLAVAALFNPLRRRVQGWVDRRFNRSHYDAQRVMDQFAGSLRDRVDPDGVINGWVGVVAETMQPSSVGVWVRASG